MADKSIAELPKLAAVTDETQIPVWQPGAANEAQSMTGKQFREFAEAAAEQYVEDATEVAEKAEQALAALGNDAQIAKKAAADAAESEAKAKLYANQTEAAAGGGVTSFNGRGGHVMPQSGDYTAEMVGALPLSGGGKISGTLSFQQYDNGKGSVYKNHAADADGGFWIKDEAKDGSYLAIDLQASSQKAYLIKNGQYKEVLHADNVGDYALKKDGSNAMTGNLYFDNKKKFISFGANTFLFGNCDAAEDFNNSTRIQLGDSSYPIETALYLLRYVNGQPSEYPILHTGNKPSGSYTGNGSTAERTIETGGIGGVCALWNASSGNSFLFVTPTGAFGKTNEGSLVLLARTGITFSNGKLVMTGDNAAFNHNGSIYSYQVL